MLYARNQEYVDEEENAKRIAFERTIAFVNKLYPDENKEVSLKPGSLTTQLKYGYESLFESWKSSVEGVLSATYSDDKVAFKSYEIIRKYNQLSSYLKNIVGMNKLSNDDELKIKSDFDKMRDNLIALKTYAIQNKPLDKDDIIDMVDKVNGSTVQPKQEYDKVETKAGVSAIITSKLSAQDEYKKMFDALTALNNVVNAPTPENTVQIRYEPNLPIYIGDIDAFVTANGNIDTVKYTEEKKREEIHDMFKKYEDVKKVLDDIPTATEIIKSIANVKKLHLEIESDEKAIQGEIRQLDPTYIQNTVDAHIKTEQTKEEALLKSELARINALTVPAPLIVLPLNLPAVVAKPSSKNSKDSAKQLQLDQKRAKYNTYLAEQLQYNADVLANKADVARFTKETDDYNDEQKKIAGINSDLTVINNKFTAFKAKLVSDIDADVVKYTNESIVIEKAYSGTQLYADFRVDIDYADKINNLQQLSDTEVEIISERSKFETMLKKKK